LELKKINEIKNKGKKEDMEDEVQDEKQDVEKQEEEVKCEECDDQKATKFCKDCETKQCEDCATHLHKLKKKEKIML